MHGRSGSRAMPSARGASPAGERRLREHRCGSAPAAAAAAARPSLVLPAALFLEPLGDPALLTEALL